MNLDEALKNPSKVNQLVLKDAFTEEIRQMSGLEELAIKGTKIKKLPKWLPELKQIKRIAFLSIDEKLMSASSCKLLAELPVLEALEVRTAKLPKEIGLLKGLKELVALQQRQIPEELFELTNLELLHLPESYLPQVPTAIANLVHLKNLDLSGCQLREMQRELVSLPALEQLNLSGNDLRKLPKNMEDMKALQKLVLIHIGLQQFPKALMSIPKLSKLNLSGNPIQKLPDNLLAMKQLKELTLKNIGLNRFPSMLLDMEDLMELDLSGNDFRTGIHSMSYMKSLRKLVMESCQLSAFPKGITEIAVLEELNLSFNKISELPSNIGKLPQLKRLVLKGVGIKPAPEEIERLKHLEWLEINDFCRCNTADKEKKDSEEISWGTSIVQAGLLGTLQEAFTHKQFGFVMYEPDGEEPFVMLATADSVYQLFCQAAERLVFGETINPKEWEGYEGLPELIKEQADEKLIEMILYLESHFDFYTHEDDYETDSYFEELSEVMPKARFVAGWSATPPYQDEAYAVLIIE